MLRHMDVGGSFINLLLLCCAIPAVLAWVLSYIVAADRRAVAIGWLYQRILFRRNSPPMESFATPP